MPPFSRTKAPLKTKKQRINEAIIERKKQLPATEEKPAENTLFTQQPFLRKETAPQKTRKMTEEEIKKTRLEEPVKTQLIQQPKIEELKQEQAKQQIPEAENIPTGTFERKTLLRKNLAEKGEFEKVSPFAQAFESRQALNRPELVENLTNITNRMKETGLTPEEITSDPQAQMLIKLQLTEMDKQNILEGNAKVTAFQQIVEGIPLIAKAEHRWIGALKTPSNEAKNLKESLKGIASDNQTNLKSFANPLNAHEYLKIAQNSQLEMLKLESRVKLLTIQSKILQANPTEVDDMMREITASKISIQNTIDQLTILSMS